LAALAKLVPRLAANRGGLREAALLTCTCGNCGAAFPHPDQSGVDGLVVANGSNPMAAAVCPACCQGSQVVKIVLRRNDSGRLCYEQYSALEMTRKAFGKAG